MASLPCAFSCRCPCVAPHSAYCLLNILLRGCIIPLGVVQEALIMVFQAYRLYCRDQILKAKMQEHSWVFFLDLGQSSCLFQWQCVRSQGNKVQSNCTPITVGQWKYTCPEDHCKYRSGFSEHNATTVICRHKDLDNAVCICYAETDPQQNQQKLANSIYSRRK